jgi:hypothetical protein
MLLSCNKRTRNQEKPSKKQKQTHHVVQKHDFSCKNEIKVSETIQSIPFFSHHFQPILEYKPLTTMFLDENDEEDDEIQDYIANTTPHATSPVLLLYSIHPQTIFFCDVFKYNDPPQSILFNIIRSFPMIVQGLICLNNVKIIHTGIRPHTIVTSENSPDFLFYKNNASFLYNERHHAGIQNHFFSLYQPQNIYLPPEFHVLCYMYTHNLSSLSTMNLETVWNDLLWYDDKKSKEREQMKKEWVFSLQSWINKPRKDIIEGLFQFSDTWNTYSVCIIYWQLVSLLQETPFKRDFSHLLQTNIHILPQKRELPHTTLDIWDRFVYTISEKEWKSA